MNGPQIIALFGSIALAGAAGVALLNLRSGRARHPWPVLALSLLGVAGNGLYVAWAIHDHGAVETFRQSHEAAMLMALLLAGVGVGTQLSRSLRGLDGFLLLLAALFDAGALLVLSRDESPAHYQPWFVSHALAFTVSSVCFLISGVVGLAYLFVHQTLRRKHGLSRVGRVPSLEALERMGRWSVAIGFPLFTYGVLTGACGLAHLAPEFRPAWYTDPTVMVALGVWAVYGFCLLAILFMPWLRGRRAAMLATGAMVLVVAALLTTAISPIHR